MPKQKGLVLVFKPGTTKEEIQKFLESIKEKLDGMPTIREFDPAWGHPVFYIP